MTHKYTHTYTHTHTHTPYSKLIGINYHIIYRHIIEYLLHLPFRFYYC